MPDSSKEPMPPTEAERPDGEFHCPQCGYRLMDGAGQMLRCPECGRRSTRTDASYWGWPRIASLHRFDQAWSGMLVALALLIIILFGLLTGIR